MAIGMESIGPMVSSGAKAALFWTVYGILLIAVLGAIYFFYYSTQFNIKMYYWQVYGNAKDGYAIDKPRKVKMKFNKERTAWHIFLKPKSRIEPFDSKHIYPGNIVYAFKFDNTFVPAKVSVTQELNNISPVPYHVKNLHFLELKTNETEFAKQDFWTQNKALLVTLIVSALCLGCVAIVAYYCLKTASATAGDIKSVIKPLESIASGLKNVAGVPG